MALGRILPRLLVTVISVVVMVVVAVLAFYLAVFVVSTGAGLADYDPDGNYVVQAAALLVVAAIVAGAVAPSARGTGGEAPTEAADDPTYD